MLPHHAASGGRWPSFGTSIQWTRSNPLRRSPSTVARAAPVR
ncbi:MAG TPA: hypothetical protein VFB66_07440 [Tepidisphaeraceae bacterium]|nr:hypothetical protein [Tepidisphaeraceae bacterium]